MEKRGERLYRNDVTKLMELLIEKNRLKEAADILISLEEGEMPVIRTLNYFINKLSLAGELDLMKRVGDHLTEVNVSVSYMLGLYVNVIL